MKKILLFAGTTEGRKLSESLLGAEIEHTLCVATAYGEIVLKRDPFVEVRRGRMNREEIREMLLAENYDAVVDATHPYAREITQNIKGAVRDLEDKNRQVSYLRLRREPAAAGQDRPERICFFDTCEDCAKALAGTTGNILLTTGSKELSAFCLSEELKKRLYVRVLPSVESLSLCRENGICGRQIIAMQGPFCREMNEAVIAQYQISLLVTKDSGAPSGFAEKLEAAKNAGIPVFVVGRPKEEEGLSFAETARELEKLCGCRILGEGRMQVVLAGVGMGSESGMTLEVCEAVKEADLVFGAPRVLRLTPAGTKTFPFYRAEEILSYLRKWQTQLLAGERKKIVVLFSGDSGFYSGCKGLYEAFGEEIGEGRLRASLNIMPGISSVSYLAARIGESYQDAAVYSMHGKKLHNLAGRIKKHQKTFLLTSGVRDVNCLGETLMEAGLAACEVVVGCQLSYEEERIERLTPKQCGELHKEGLYTCLVKNPNAKEERLTHGYADEAFIRGSVPMTKEEVREISICKLRLRRNAVVCDIGSGTGSVAVEIAGLSDEIQVYALEKKPEAVFLIHKNKEKFGLENIAVVEGQAAERLPGISEATHAFIGGSGGKLKEIARILYRINPGMRVVITAVSLETLGEIQKILSEFPVKEEETIQVQVSRAKEAGSHHLLRAENPVWICSFTFCKKGAL